MDERDAVGLEWGEKIVTRGGSTGVTPWTPLEGESWEQKLARPFNYLSYRHIANTECYTASRWRNMS